MAVQNHIRAAEAFAKRNPLIAYPALMALILWIILTALIVKDSFEYYDGQVGAYMFLVFSNSGIMSVVPLLVAYFTFLPGIVAWHRKHPSRAAVSWMCLLTLIPFLGWVFWIGLMFYAALSETSRVVPTVYGEGSIVNGHVLRNNEWVRI